MALFREISRPPANACFESHLDWAAQKDPIGHRVHLGLALFALALIPLSSSLASIGSTPLLVYTLLRAPTLYSCWSGLLKNPCFLCLLGLYAWLALTLTWSPDPEHGLRLLRGSRFLLIVPALLPLMRHAGLLLAAVCSGVFIQNAAQFSKWMFIQDYFGGGLEHHPGFTGLWFILAIGILLTYPSPGETPRLSQRFSAMFPTMGITITGARSILLGGATSLLLLTGLTLVFRRSGWKITSVAGIFMLVLLCAPLFMPQTPMAERVSDAFEGLQSNSQMTEVDAPGLEEIRYVWWEIAMTHWRDAWLIGDGLGSAEQRIHESPRLLEATNGGTEKTYLLRDDYHSLFVTVCAESGAVGLVLLSTWLGLLARQIRRAGPLSMALYMGFIGYLIFSVFNTTIFSGRVVSLPLTIMALSSHALPRSRSLSDAIRHEEYFS
ncbi:MAG: hypothetical protein CMJ33_04065 [Phycisphaerae bacterium]|nr:hypothetical protein [Phycisphaerae bacterium]